MSRRYNSPEGQLCRKTLRCYEYKSLPRLTSHSATVSSWIDQPQDVERFFLAQATFCTRCSCCLSCKQVQCHLYAQVESLSSSFCCQANPTPDKQEQRLKYNFDKRERLLLTMLLLAVHDSNQSSQSVHHQCYRSVHCLFESMLEGHFRCSHSLPPPNH